MGLSHSQMLPWAAEEGRLEDLVTHLGSVRNVKEALLAPATESNPKRNSPLHMAAKNGHSQCVRVLYDAGSSLKACNKDGHTPLHLAASRHHLHCTQLLLQLGASPSTATRFGVTSLHLAASTGNCHIVEELVKWGTAIDAQESWGQTALTIATASFRVDCMKTLLRLGASTDVKDHQHSQTALHVACGNRDEESVLVLLDGGGDVYATNKEGLSVLGVALRNQFYRVLPLLLEYGAHPNCSDLLHMSTALQEHITAQTSTPLSLRRLCRVSFRQSLGPTCLDQLQAAPGLDEDLLLFVNGMLDLCDGAEVKAKALDNEP